MCQSVHVLLQLSVIVKQNLLYILEFILNTYTYTLYILSQPIIRS